MEKTMVDRMEPKHKLTIHVVSELRTIHGYTIEEYVEAREEMKAELAGDIEIIAMARAASNAAPLIVASAPAVASAPPGALADNPWPAAPPAFAAAASAAPNCAHGPRTGRSGTGAKGPWKAWFCNTPKGTPDQCEAIFLNRNTPEWNAHTA
jgi:hypothetical protein